MIKLLKSVLYFLSIFLILGCESNSNSLVIDNDKNLTTNSDENRTHIQLSINFNSTIDWIKLSKDNEKLYAIGCGDSSEAGLSVIDISNPLKAEVLHYGIMNCSEMIEYPKSAISLMGDDAYTKVVVMERWC